MSYLQENTKPVTLFELGKMRAEGRKIVMLTGYDASFAALLERCGVRKPRCRSRSSRWSITPNALPAAARAR